MFAYCEILDFLFVLCAIYKIINFSNVKMSIWLRSSLSDYLYGCLIALISNFFNHYYLPLPYYLIAFLLEPLGRFGIVGQTL